MDQRIIFLESIAGVPGEPSASNERKADYETDIVFYYRHGWRRLAASTFTTPDEERWRASSRDSFPTDHQLMELFHN